MEIERNNQSTKSEKTKDINNVINKKQKEPIQLEKQINNIIPKINNESTKSEKTKDINNVINKKQKEPIQLEKQINNIIPKINNESTKSEKTKDINNVINKKQKEPIQLEKQINNIIPKTNNQSITSEEKINNIIIDNNINIPRITGTKFNMIDLLKAGVHFGHVARKWNPNMSPFIFMKKKGIHIIDLSKTIIKLYQACKELIKIISFGKKILLVGTKAQAKEKVMFYAKILNMPCVTERWLGGLLTNFSTIRKSIKKMNNIEKMKKNGTFDTLSKKERLLINRIYSKLYKNLGSISSMNQLPGGIFLIDPYKEKIALSEAIKLKIPIFAMIDTNTNPNNIQFPIPSNDDSSKSINLILQIITNIIVKNQ